MSEKQLEIHVELMSISHSIKYKSTTVVLAVNATRNGCYVLGCLINHWISMDGVTAKQVIPHSYIPTRTDTMPLIETQSGPSSILSRDYQSLMKLHFSTQVGNFNRIAMF
jgi:hypothetical protein